MQIKKIISIDRDGKYAPTKELYFQAQSIEGDTLIGQVIYEPNPGSEYRFINLYDNCSGLFSDIDNVTFESYEEVIDSITKKVEGILKDCFIE